VKDEKQVAGGPYFAYAYIPLRYEMLYFHFHGGGMRVHLAGVVILLLMSFSNSIVIADPIDLNYFLADPSVSVDGDGESATMSEDPDFSTVYLYSEDSTLFPSDPFVLSFSYVFTVAAGNFDDFYAMVFDIDTGAIIKEFFIEYNNSTGSNSWVESDTIVWGIGGAPSSGLGLEFQLNSWEYPSDDYYDINKVFKSTVQLSNVEFNLNSVPEPAAIFMFGLGLVGLAYAGRKNMLGLN